ncbi:P1 family peptidase [Phototrophicus methaneseepsis]|uniref:P1 family peptidase n=1 Tax=Phototrophicus methaneseepsis TaxID=2710758 RepID=A0A7S8ICG0_9CHLR|nr:P1 family peptidase [Phototrophicus methaneseepsis]QPC80487.1 P1 family peptidase [Phototrophicus methaneseepsis]
MTLTNTLTDVPGIRVGHATDLLAATGCTVILCPPNTIGAVDVRGGAPGTRETDLLRPENSVQAVNAVVLAGGSAFGLNASTGVMRYLAEQGEGYRTATGQIVPIVVSAILFDLGIGQADVYPDAAMGYTACQAATSEEVAQGTIGAGTGAMLGAMMGPAQATKGGIGSASMAIGEELVVSAIVAVNAVGDVVGESGRIIAGLRDSQTDKFVGVLNMLRQMPPVAGDASGVENTVIGAIATNAKLTKAQAYKVAQMAHDGIARAVRPAHTPFDGDTIFALATGEVAAETAVVGAFAAEVMATAIRNAVHAATSLHGVRAIDNA